MDYKKFIGIIQERCRFLTDAGYELGKLQPSVDRNIWFEKRHGDERFRLSFTWSKHPHGLQVSGLNALKRFDAVENKLQDVLGGDFSNHYTVQRRATAGDVPKGLSFEQTQYDIIFVLKGEQDANYFLDFLKMFYANEAVPFFARVEDIKGIGDIYKNLKREEIQTLVLNYGNDIFYREFVIRKQIGIDIDELYEELVKEFDPFKDNPTYAKILTNLKKVRDSLNEK